MMSAPVYVVKVSESLPCFGGEFSVKVFSTREKAEAWVASRIASIVKEHGLDESLVDDWHVEIAPGHAFQFDVEESDVE